MSRFWLYLGIFLACSGIGTIAGVLMIVFYFWDDIKKTIQRQQARQNTQQVPSDPKFYDDETAESLK